MLESLLAPTPLLTHPMWFWGALSKIKPAMGLGLNSSSQSLAQKVKTMLRWEG